MRYSGKCTTLKLNASAIHEALTPNSLTKEAAPWQSLLTPWQSLLLTGCLTSQLHAHVSQERICSDNCTCCHTETEVANQACHLTQSQNTDTEPTSPTADPATPGRTTTGVPILKSYASTWKNKDPRRKRDSNLGLLLSRRTTCRCPDEVSSAELPSLNKVLRSAHFFYLARS